MKRFASLFLVCIGLAVNTICVADQPSKAQEYINRIVERAREINGDTSISDDDAAIVDPQNNDSVEYDESDIGLLTEFFARQEEYKTALIQSAEDRLAEYWNVELIDIQLYLDDAYIFGETEKEHFSVINVMLRWNVEKNQEQTRRMLSSYSDDMAVTLHSVYPDVPIDQMRILWEVPNILKDGYAAKYQYYSIGDDMFCSDRYGVLNGRV